MPRRRTGRKVGRPPLPSTLWLRDALQLGIDPAYLYHEWLWLHYEICGYDLACPKRSYMAALANCAKWVQITSS